MSMENEYPFINSKTIQLDIYDCILGKEIGRGMSRIVYQHRTDPTLVVKVEQQAGSFQNIREAELWFEISGTKFKKWFAPVVYVSACGTVIMQKKCDFLDKKKYPDKIPTFLFDTKYSNYGMLDGKFVCFDYGTIPFTANWSEKMKKSNFWEE